MTNPGEGSIVTYTLYLQCHSAWLDLHAKHQHSHHFFQASAAMMAVLRACLQDICVPDQLSGASCQGLSLLDIHMGSLKLGTNFII